MAARSAKPRADTPISAWPPTWVRALDDESLRRASSPAIFQRGSSYATEGLVDVRSEDPLPDPAIEARVHGSEIYATSVWMEDGALAGNCDCPHARDGWFCKHQVALALVWRERLTQAPKGDAKATTAAGSPRPRAVRDHRLALRDFLYAQEPAALADRLLAIADTDRDIWRELQQWRELGALKGRRTDLRPLVDDMLSTGQDFIPWNEAASQARRAAAVLPLLRQARDTNPATAVALCVHAIRRAWHLLENADDSAGEIGAVCEAIGVELAGALRDAGPQAAKFGETYLQLQLEDPSGSLDAPDIEAALGEIALARYRQLLAERWCTAKAAGASDLWALESLHLDQLKRAGNDEAVLAILREDSSTARGHGRVVAFLESLGRFDEALAQAIDGHAAFPDDRRLEAGLLRCQERAGQVREAFVLRQTRFETEPGVEAYHLTLDAGRAAGEDPDALRTALFDVLQRHELASPARPSAGWMRARTAPPTRDVSLRAEVLCSEGRWMEACLLAQPPLACRGDVLHKIALHLPARHRKQAVEMLLRVFEATMQRASSPYREALALVDEIDARMAATRRTAWLAELRTRYKAKRNFIRDLP